MTEQNLVALQYHAFLKAISILTQSHFSLFPSPEDTSANVIPEKAEGGVFGRKAEFFFSHWLKHSPRYEWLAENIQVITDGQTLGELDFIVRDLESKRLLQIEMACKFYLLKATTTPVWVGPNHRDWLHLKLEKLYHRQFPLLYRPETKKTLHNMDIAVDHIYQQLYMPGLLFTPYNSTDPVAPGITNRLAFGGQWVSQAHFKDTGFSRYEFAIPPKENWLLEPGDYQGWSPHQQTFERIWPSLNKRRSPMLWMRSPGKPASRLFVVWW